MLREHDTQSHLARFFLCEDFFFDEDGEHSQQLWNKKPP